jgi:hypothetical protein
MVSQQTVDYITSERFIHDELCRRATIGVDMLPKLWKQHGVIQSSLILWPAESVKTDDGGEIENMVYAQMPDEESERIKFLRAAVARGKAYAILVTEQHEDTVKAIFESHHGTRCWTFDIERHGDIRLLSKPDVKDDAECVGILWQPKSRQA